MTAHIGFAQALYAFKTLIPLTRRYSRWKGNRLKGESPADFSQEYKINIEMIASGYIGYINRV